MSSSSRIKPLPRFSSYSSRASVNSRPAAPKPRPSDKELAARSYSRMLEFWKSLLGYSVDCIDFFGQFSEPLGQLRTAATLFATQSHRMMTDYEITEVVNQVYEDFLGSLPDPADIPFEEGLL